MRISPVLSATASCLAIGMAALSSPALAQSTGTVDFENEIIVTGNVPFDVSGVQLPPTSKAKQVLTAEAIQRNNPGQTILDSINVVPGVTFTNNDAYGGSGGQLTIRGFGQDRISLTFDGIPLNDSGNYQIYSQQQIDPELIEEVNINLGTTDVDSPTAAATGSTVNYRTRNPSEEFGAKMIGTVGEDKHFRMFGVVDTGAFGPFGTRAFFAASHAEDHNPFNNYGRVNKNQYNAKIYQAIGSGDDFISIAGHYNENRNNFFGSLPLRLDTTQSSTDSAPRVAGSLSNNRFPITKDERFYKINYPCQVAASGVTGAADAAGSCGTEFDRRYNPSNTGNIRLASRFTLSDSLTLSVDPSFQWVKANGGGTVGARERLNDIAPGSAVTNVAGYMGGRPYFGRDLNGDGDLLDEVNVLAPSQTRTRRWVVISNLKWQVNDNHSLRVSYTLDRAWHRQTGEVTPLLRNGEPVTVFAIDKPMADITGVNLQKRDRKSIALLNQVSAEYRGQFMDEALVVTLGVRAPFFKRDLNQYCFTTAVNGNVDCFGKDDPRNASYGTLNPTIQGPQRRVLKYDEILPNIGLVFKATPDLSVFANYSKGLQVPGTDSLYNAFFFAPNTPSALPSPETTDNFDMGLRFRSGGLQAQFSGWYTKYKDRLASAYDPETDRNVYRNLGGVDKYGVDGSIGWSPVENFSLYAFGNWMKSKIKDNVQSGECTQAQVTAAQLGCISVGQPTYFLTKGKRESGAPAYNYGVSARGILGPVELGVTAKRTGGRYIYDTNEPLVFNGRQVYGAKTNAYWMVNLDARMSLEVIGMNDKSYLQLNVYNLTDALYVGNFTTAITPAATPPFANIGAPRTVSGSVVFAF